MRAYCNWLLPGSLMLGVSFLDHLVDYECGLEWTSIHMSAIAVVRRWKQLPHELPCCSCNEVRMQTNPNYS